MNSLCLTLSDSYLSVTEWIQSAFITGLSSVAGVVLVILITIGVVLGSWLLSKLFSNGCRYFSSTSNALILLAVVLLTFCSSAVYIGLTENDFAKKLEKPTQAAQRDMVKDAYSLFVKANNEGLNRNGASGPEYDVYDELFGSDYQKLTVDEETAEDSPVIGEDGKNKGVKRKSLFKSGLMSMLDKYRVAAGKVVLSLEDIGLNPNMETHDEESIKAAVSKYVADMEATYATYDTAKLIAWLVLVLSAVFMFVWSICLALGAIKILPIDNELASYTKGW